MQAQAFIAGHQALHQPQRPQSVARQRAAGDPAHTGVWFGEAAGIIHKIEPAADILQRTSSQALQLLNAHRPD